MNENFKKFKKAHNPKRKDKIIHGFYGKYIARYVSLPIAWTLVHTPVSANQVTIFMMLTGLVGAFLVGFPKLALTGCILLQAALMMDAMDGVIARYKKQESTYGKYIDAMFHSLAMPLLFFMLGSYTYHYFNNVIFLFLGFGTSFCIFGASSSYYNKIYFVATKKIISSENLQLIAEYRKNIVQKLISKTIIGMNRFTNIFTIFLIAKIFNLLQYLIFIYFPFYFLIFIVKIVLEFNSAKKELK